VIDEDFYDFVISRRYQIGKLVKDKKSFEHALTSIKIKDNKVVFYYTGHGVPSSLVLPDLTEYYYHHLQSHLEKLVSQEMVAHFFYIMDCCHCNAMMLPFKFDLAKQDFKLKGKYHDRSTSDTTIISSSSKKDLSYSYCSGSSFTNYFFSYLKSDQDYDFVSLLKFLRLENSNKAQVYTNTLKLAIPSWVVNRVIEIYYQGSFFSVTSGVNGIDTWQEEKTTTS